MLSKRRASLSQYLDTIHETNNDPNNNFFNNSLTDMIEAEMFKKASLQQTINELKIELLITKEKAQDLETINLNILKQNELLNKKNQEFVKNSINRKNTKRLSRRRGLFIKNKKTKKAKNKMLSDLSVNNITLVNNEESGVQNIKSTALKKNLLNSEQMLLFITTKILKFTKEIKNLDITNLIKKHKTNYELTRLMDIANQKIINLQSEIKYWLVEFNTLFNSSYFDLFSDLFLNNSNLLNLFNNLYSEYYRLKINDSILVVSRKNSIVATPSTIIKASANNKNKTSKANQNSLSTHKTSTSKQNKIIFTDLISKNNNYSKKSILLSKILITKLGLINAKPVETVVHRINIHANNLHN